MNHSLKVALKFYYSRPTCPFIFGDDTTFQIDPRPTQAGINIDNIIFPVQHEAREGLLTRARELQQDPAIEEYFNDMRAAHKNGGVSKIPLNTCVEALEGLLEPGNPYEAFSMGGYDICTAIQGVLPSFFSGFKLHTDEQRDQYIDAWLKLPHMAWTNVTHQWQLPVPTTVQVRTPVPTTVQVRTPVPTTVQVRTPVPAPTPVIPSLVQVLKPRTTHGVQGNPQSSLCLK
jgi:hypothetical protein